MVQECHVVGGYMHEHPSIHSKQNVRTLGIYFSWFLYSFATRLRYCGRGQKYLNHGPLYHYHHYIIYYWWRKVFCCSLKVFFWFRRASCRLFETTSGCSSGKWIGLVGEFLCKNNTWIIDDFHSNRQTDRHATSVGWLAGWLNDYGRFR